MSKPRYTIAEKREFAQKMRENPTDAEALLWLKLNKNQTGYRFQRQVTLYGFIVDFWCPKAKLAIEVDGFIHETTEVSIKDSQKDAALAERGILLLRFMNSDVFFASREVVSQITAECDHRMQSQTPLKGVGFAFRPSRKTPPVVAVSTPETSENRHSPKGNGARAKVFTESARVCKSSRETPEVCRGQRITAADRAAIRGKVVQLAHKHSIDVVAGRPSISRSRWEQKLRLAEQQKKAPSPVNIPAKEQYR